MPSQPPAPRLPPPVRANWARPLVLAVTLLLAAAGAWAQTMVSIARDHVNMRAGAGTQHEVLWQLARGYPLQVVGRRAGWLQVRDFEGDTGWVLVQCSTLCGTSNRVFARLASLQILAMPPGIAVVCA